MSEDRFLEQLRAEARRLCHDPGDVAVARVAARVRARVMQPTIAESIATWFRPVAATLTAMALAATIGLTLVERNQSISWTSDPVEVAMGGDIFSVAE